MSGRCSWYFDTRIRIVKTQSTFHKLKQAISVNFLQTVYSALSNRSYRGLKRLPKGGQWGPDADAGLVPTVTISHRSTAEKPELQSNTQICSGALSVTDDPSALRITRFLVEPQRKLCCHCYLPLDWPLCVPS